MNRKLTTLLVSGLFVAASATTAVAHHNDGHTQNYFGLCTAYQNNGNNDQGKAFQDFWESVSDEKDENGDSYDDLSDFCEDYLANNHPSDNGKGNGGGRG